MDYGLTNDKYVWNIIYLRITQADVKQAIMGSVKIRTILKYMYKKKNTNSKAYKTRRRKL